MTDSYHEYFDAMPCYLTVQDREFRIIEANARFRRDFGEYDGRYCYQVYKHRSEKCEICPVEKAFWDGECHRSQETVRCLDGREVSVLVEANPVRGESGEIETVMEMSTDITMIKRLEAQLRHSQDRYHYLFEKVPCYITVQSPDLRIIETNREFRKDFGESLGCYCYKAYKHRDEECYPCPVRETFADGKVRTRETVVASASGEPINVLVTTSPIRNSEGEIISVMEMSTNITQVRELESQLTWLGLLVGSVSHGLKGLLNGLSGGMYLVNTGFKKQDDERIRKGWEIVERNVRRIKSMVSDILYYAKDREPNWEMLDAEQVAADTKALMDSRAAEFGVDLVVKSGPDAGRFHGDPQAIRSMLVNLLENSLDACRLDTRKSEHGVSLIVSGDERQVRFEIADNGIGMDRETVEKAFTLFFSSKGTEGTGLGLFVSNRIALAHGGKIVLESEAGSGTRFQVMIPREKSRDASPQKEKNDDGNTEKDPRGR